ncbi:MAG: rhomboid family intramembrane serine protease [Fimbriimonadales bacterium]
MSTRGRLPIATLILIVANIIAAFALVWQPDLIYEFGFNPVRPTFESVWASMFLHANLFHLFANMLFLAAVGAAVELATGTLRFIAVYFASGLAGIALHAGLAARNVSEPHPLVGASGCIAGCAAYYGIRYLSMRVPVAPKVGVPVAGVIGVWLALQVLGAFKTIGDPIASTAFWAHLGGFGAGLVMCFVFRAPDLGQLRLGHEVIARMNERGPAAAVVAALRHLEVHPDDPTALKHLVEAHKLMNDSEGEAGALVRIIDLLPEDDVGVPICRLRDLGELGRLPPLKRIRLAERVRSQDPQTTKLLLESVIDEPASEPQRPEAMLALAGLNRDDNPEAASSMLTRLQSEYPLHPAVELARARGWMT